MVMSSKTKTETEKKKEGKGYEIDKFVFVGGRLVSFLIKGKKDMIAEQDVIENIESGDTYTCTIEGKQNTIKVADIGNGKYLSVKNDEALQNSIPIMVKTKGKNAAGTVEEINVPNPDIYQPS